MKMTSSPFIRSNRLRGFGIMLLMLLAVAGCAAPQVADNKLPAIFQESARMLLASAPFTTICLEVDSVEGAEAPAGAIDALAGFLRDTCHKPVAVVTKKPIPAGEAGQTPAWLIALQHMSGPPASAPTGSTAYVYVFLYRGPGDWDNAGVTRFDYPCAMFLDVAAGFSTQTQISFGLKHEAGHMLTLGSNPAHGDGTHCNNKSCLMYRAFSTTRSFLGLQHADLCAACQRDLAELQRSIQPTNLVFKGPFIVRQERGYLVARLPGTVHVEIGEPGNFAWQERLELLRSQMREVQTNRPDVLAYMVAHPEAILQSGKCEVQTRQEYLRQQGAIAAACADADPAVRQIARERIKAPLEEEFGPAATQPAR